MSHKYPFLKSSSDPYGLLEQLGVALTIDPREDASLTGDSSWFGKLLANDFTWEYQGDNTNERLDRQQFVGNYFNSHTRFTAYNWECYSLSIPEGAAGTTGSLAGEVDVKVTQCAACNGSNEHNGLHRFECSIVKVNGKWKVNRWILARV